MSQVQDTIEASQLKAQLMATVGDNLELSVHCMTIEESFNALRWKDSRWA